MVLFNSGSGGLTGVPGGRVNVGGEELSAQEWRVVRAEADEIESVRGLYAVHAGDQFRAAVRNRDAIHRLLSHGLEVDVLRIAGPGWRRRSPGSRSFRPLV